MNQKQKLSSVNYFCQCTNNQINVIQEIMEFRKQDPVNISARANLAMQLIIFNESIEVAYDLINDLLGLEAQNVKALIQLASIHFNMFECLGIQKQCNLLIDMANQYQIPAIALRLFFEQPFHDLMLKTRDINNQHISNLCKSHISFIRGIIDEEVPETAELFKFSRNYEMDAKVRLTDDLIFFVGQEFNRLTQSDLHEQGFQEFCKLKTLQLIKRKDIREINSTLRKHFTVEIQLYMWTTKTISLNFLSSMMIVKFNMLLLQLLFTQDNTIDLSFFYTELKDDPQQLLVYLLQIIALLISQQQQLAINKILNAIQYLQFEQVENAEYFQGSVNALLKSQPAKEIIEFFKNIFKTINEDIYQKFAIFNNSFEDLGKISKKQAIHNLITSILIKQDKDYLARNIDKLFELMCNVKSKNPRRALCNFLELIYILQYRYETKFLQQKLTEYFSYSQEDLNSTLLMIYQQLEIEVQSQSIMSFEYIAIVAKLLHLILIINQNLKNKTLHMEYFSMQMQIINNFTKKLPKSNEQIGPDRSNSYSRQFLQLKNIKKKKAILMNLALIERFYKLHQINPHEISVLKLSILSTTSETPEYLLLQICQNEKEYQMLKKEYTEPIKYKELNFYCKLERLKKQFNQPIIVKPILALSNLNRFIKHAEKLLLQKQLTTITKIQILEQLLPQLTSSLFEFSQKPKFYEELFQQSEIHIFKFEHREYIQFYLGTGELCSPTLFINLRAEAIYLYLKICHKLIKLLNRMGFYKAIASSIGNIVLFTQRVLGVCTLINIYSQIPWIESLQFQSIVDGVCNVVQYLNKKQNYGLELSESTRQSLYKQRRSCLNKLKESYNKIVQHFDADNILNGKFKRAYVRFILEYLCLQNHSQSYLYEKLILTRTETCDLKTNCCILKQLFRCSDPRNYNCLVNESCRHELIADKSILNQIVPTLVLGLCEQEQNQNLCNYGWQLLIFVQNQLAQFLQQNIEQSKLYMYLYLRLKEHLNDLDPQFDRQIRCKCPLQKKFDANCFEFDLIASLASFQMNQKRILTQQEDLSILKCENLNKISELTSIVDLNLRRDTVVINFFEYNGEKVILISKYCYQTNQCINKSITSISKCLQFKDALIYYLTLIQENLDCLDEKFSVPNQWWSKRDHYEQQLLKKQLNIEEALSEHLDLIYKSSNPLLILSPQLQLLPWDHIRNTVFNRVLSLGHILDLINLPIDPKQDLFYILNPGQDLDKSEKKLLPLLQSFNLKGLTREKPKQQLIVDCLQKRDYYLYIGHGGGEQYINERQILQTTKYLNGRPYLLGCSSAQMIDLSKFKGTNVSSQEIYLDHVDWHGLAVSYLLKGCPSLFGALWPITDRDADQYAQDLINQYGKTQEFKPEQVILQTRPKCNLKILNGTAFVLYGIHEMKQ